MKNNNPANFCRESIYTLAQNGTANDTKPAVIIRGKGSEIKTGDGEKRGKRKLISLCTALNLIDIAKEKGRNVKPFWNTYYCMNRIVSHDGKLYGNYCKNRFCPVCTAIRKAEKINDYYPVLKEWKAPYFVTLTIKACKHPELKKMMEGCIRAMRKITAKYRKRNQRGYSKQLIGIRSLECNFNPIKQTYNPHFHIIVPDRETAQILIMEWINIWNRKNNRYTSIKAQDYKPVWDLENALVEAIKYGSKIFTAPKTNNENDSKISPIMYAKAYYNIIQAMQNLRLFERFGFNLPKKDRGFSVPFVTVDFEKWKYSSKYHDWLHIENELTLTGYELQSELANLLKYGIDKSIE